VSSGPCAPTPTMEKDVADTGVDPRRVILIGGIISSLVVVANMAEMTETRGSCLLIVVLLLQFSGAVPLYCIGLLMPVLATVLRTLPGSAEDTARACFASMMNPMTAVVLGSFSVHAICLQCRLEARFLTRVTARFGERPKTFLLLLMLGCMLCSALTLVTLLALAAVRPIAQKARGGGGASVVLGVGIACTLGGVLTPIAGAPSLVLLSVLQEYGRSVSFLDWLFVAVPTQTAVCVAAWAVLLGLFGAPPPVTEQDLEMEKPPPLGAREKFFLGLSGLFLLGCIAEPVLRPVIGDPGNLGLLLCCVTFSAFLGKADFLALPWDVLALLFGVNTMSLVLKDSGLARLLAANVIPTQVYDVTLWFEVLKLTACAVSVASLAPHAVVATIGLPVVVALGFQLYAPVLVPLLVVQALACGVATPYSSMDLLMTVEAVESTPRASGERPIAERKDFVRGGVAVTVVGWAVVSTVGYLVALSVLGVPPQHIIIQEPAELKPTIERWSEEKATAARLDDLEDRIEDLLPVNEDAPAEWGAHTSLTMAGRWGAKLPVATPVPVDTEPAQHAPQPSRLHGPHLRLHPRLLNHRHRVST